MPERPKGHDWKSCVPTKIGTEGSNPSLSARLRQYAIASSDRPEKVKRKEVL